MVRFSVNLSNYGNMTSSIISDVRYVIAYLEMVSLVLLHLEFYLHLKRLSTISVWVIVYLDKRVAATYLLFMTFIVYGSDVGIIWIDGYSLL